MAVFKRAGEVVQVVKIVRAPLLVSVFTGIALFLPDQTREVYRILAQPWRAYGYVQLVFAIAVVGLATFVPAIVARHLLLRHARHLLLQTDVPGVLSRWLPRLCGALIPLGIATGLVIASREMSFELPARLVDQNPGVAQLRTDAHGVSVALGWSAALCLAIAATPLIWGARLDRLLGEGGAGHAWPSRSLVIGLTAFIILASIVVSLAPVAIAQVLGSLPILLIFMMTLVLALGTITAHFDTYRVPVISCLFVLAVAFSSLNWNDNHAVRLEKREATRLPTASDALDAWLDTPRRDREHYGEEPYPVFFVTAAGGGMYAAHHAATVLARLQDRCPNFAQHVFAISAVSGGSVGAAVFASLAKHYAPNIEHQPCRLGPLPTGPMEERVHKYFLDADFLAPVVAASLFPDFLQRFLPVPIGKFDRARALEEGLASAWPHAAPEHANENPFRRPFLSQRDAQNPGPALILNATDVEYGYRVAVAPFEVVSLGGIENIAAMTKIVEFHNAFHGMVPASEWEFDRDLSLGSAVGLSARFPWVLPAGTVPLAKRDARLVDGGYIENSGAEALLDLLRSLKSSYRGKGKRKIAVHIISISSLQLIETSSWQGIGEILSPIRAMLSSRDSRGAVSIYRVASFPDDCLADKACNQAEDQFRVFPLDLLDFPIPLGWQISPISAGLIGLQSGHADRVDTAQGGDVTNETRDTRVAAYIEMAHESACAVQKILHGLPLSDSCKPR
jgi:hypothetical protein